MTIAACVLGQVSVDSDLFGLLPEWGKVILIIAIALLILAVVTKYTADAVKSLRGIGKKKKVDAQQLENHTFFSKCESWARYKVNELYFGDEIRNRLFRTIISTKVQVMSFKSREILNNAEMRDMTKPCFQTYMFKLLTDIHIETQQQIRNKIIEMYPIHGQDIFDLVMNHQEKGFNAFNQITDNYTERLVQIICESDLYSDNYEKYEIILDAFKSSLGAAFPHIESTFKGFNGELDAMVIKR